MDERIGLADVDAPDAVAWHALTAPEVLARLDSSPRGLSSGEARHRFERYGPNSFGDVEPVSAIRVFLRQFTSPLIVILLVAAVVTSLLQEWIDSAVIAVILLLNAVIGFVQERKADTSVRALMQMAVPKARVVRDDREMDVDSRELVPGDVVLLESGTRVPADLRLVSVQSLLVDESLLTGESDPVDKHTRTLDPDLSLGDRGSIAYGGSTVTRGRGTGVVVATGTATEIGGIAELIRSEPDSDTPLGRRMSQLAKVIGVAVLVASLAVFAIGLARGGELSELFMAAVALAVAAVPEGLPIVVTIALAVGVTRMARRRAIVRRLPAVEALGSATVIGSDKTGTLTENRMTVQQVWAGGRFHQLADVRVERHQPAPHDHDPAALTLLVGVLTNEATTPLAAPLAADDESASVHGDPTEVALLLAAAAAGFVPDLVRDTFPTVTQTPFEPELRFSATLRRDGDEEVLFVKGAPERVLDMCDAQAGDSGETDLDRGAVHDAAAQMAGSGLRVLGMAISRSGPHGARSLDAVEPSGLLFVGLVGMKDPPRPGVNQAVAACHRASVRVIMITGDHAATAASIAGELGIPNDPVLTGADLEHLENDALRRRVRDGSVFARVSPEGKLRIVRALQDDGEVVAVTGDGVNDAPALKAASIGVAMGRDGTDVAREAADIVLADDNFTSIVNAIEEGRVTFENVRRATFFLVSTGAATIVALLAGVSAGWPLLMLPAQLLWLNLVTNGLQDVALAFERGEADILNRPPRRPREGILSRRLWHRTALTGLVMAVGTLAMFRWELDRGGSLTAAQTVALTTMVAFMALQAGNARSELRSVFTVPLRDNPFLVVTAIAAFAVHVGALYFPPTQVVLRVEPLDAAAWVRIAAVATAVLVVVEIDKAIRRHRAQQEIGDEIMAKQPPQIEPAHREPLVAAAILAPSMHNTQPWRFRFAADRVEVHRDPHYELPVEDPQRRMSLISAGAALFNLRVAADHLGYDTTATLYNQTDRTLVAELQLTQPVSTEEHRSLAELYPYLTVRRTNRNPFSDEAIPGDVKTALVTAAADEGCMLDWIHDPSRRDWVLSLSADANMFDNTDAARRAERARWVGGDRDRDGIPAAALGPRPDRRSAPVRDLAATRPDRGRPAARFETDPTLAVIATRYDTPRSWLIAGQALEHVWLEAARHGVAISPLTQAVEHAELRWLVRDPRAGWSEPQVVLRLGYGSPTPATPRRPVSEFVDVD